MLTFLPWIQAGVFVYAKLFFQVGFIFFFTDGALSALINIIKKDLSGVATMQLNFSASGIFLICLMALDPSVFYSMFSTVMVGQ